MRILVIINILESCSRGDEDALKDSAFLVRARASLGRRGLRPIQRGRQYGNPSPIMPVAITAEQPSPQSLKRLEHEYWGPDSIAAGNPARFVNGTHSRGLRMRKNLASVVSAALVIFSLACSQKSSRYFRADDREIRVGSFLSLTGETASYGISSLNAFKLATEQMNAAGGIDGKQIELVVEDDHSKTQEVAALVNKLISEDKVHALLGESISTRALVAAPIAQANKVVMISPAAIKPEITAQGDYVFRACFISPVEGAAIARFAVNNLKAKRAAIILDEKNDYAVVLANFFREHFSKLGGEVVVQENYAASDTDLSK